MVSHSLVLGYHGCDARVARKVVAQKDQLRQEEKKPAFDTVRGFFIEGKELYAGAGFRELDHIQICVRSLEQIIGFFWPRQ
jgi:hypothetical protein